MAVFFDSFLAKRSILSCLDTSQDYPTLISDGPHLLIGGIDLDRCWSGETGATEHWTLFTGVPNASFDF